MQFKCRLAYYLRISSTGIGEVISLQKLNISSLRRAIKRVLTKNSYKKNARRIQQSIELSGGVKQAANIIEQVTEQKSLDLVISH
ncbi:MULTISPECIES: hypothetical protein [unclassified Nostoc]|uniref:hypothetical protein n=1 Tax=unclassified Nostoc TaxID=2593658 RepID=UPI002AD36A55|nr:MULTISPECIES: hypothetical protein [unclassified Nostoc]MDZ8123029.1 hypothetical protein [Nostoc sp. CmiVER01]MDZ8225190.1 hypothetical protein [Nostoc sp. ChiVER01]